MFCATLMPWIRAQFLVDDRNAELLGGILAVFLRDVVAIEGNAAGVAVGNAGDDLDQGGFAGTVLADQGMDLAAR